MTEVSSDLLEKSLGKFESGVGQLEV